MSGLSPALKWIGRKFPLSLVVFAFLILVPCMAAQESTSKAQQRPQGKQEAAIQAAPASGNPSAISIKVETSRKQIEPREALGITADITNNSGVVVFLRDRDIQLVLPPELRPDVGTYSKDCWFPTEYLEAQQVIALKPKETYRVFWRSDPRETVQEQAPSSGPSAGRASAMPAASASLWQWLQFVKFNPGAYPITVEAKYWYQKKFDEDSYHTAVETTEIEFAAPQSIILLGAVVGGLIFTFLVMIRAQEKPTRELPAGAWDITKSLGRITLAALGSILLSVIVTILLSRIAETQFIIKVSIADFWGAIAIGFVANYGGWALIDKMVPKAGAGEETDKLKSNAAKQP